MLRLDMKDIWIKLIIHNYIMIKYTYIHTHKVSTVVKKKWKTFSQRIYDNIEGLSHKINFLYIIKYKTSQISGYS